jgi:nicotinamidase-related amidase
MAGAIAPERSTIALLLVDFINPFNFDNAQALPPRAIAAARAAAVVKARASAHKIPCIYANDNFGRWTSEFSALTTACAQTPGAAGTIAQILTPARGDFSVLKPRHSAFYGTPLEFLLQELQVSQLIIAGLTTDICVFATAQDAYIRQFQLWIPSDCSASFTPGFEKAALTHMARTLKARTQPAQRAGRMRAPALRFPGRRSSA